MFLETKRLRIREFTEQDAAFIVKLLNEPAFIQHIADKGVRSLKDAERYLEEGPMASYGKFGFGLWHVALKKTGLPIGMCGLLKRDYLEDVDIGFAFLADHWRKGYALEAASAVMAHATGCLGLEKLVAIVGKDNARSVSLLGKLDFRFERYIRLPDETTDVMLMAHQGNGQGMQAGKGEKLAILTGGALDLGASGVKVIAAGDIVIRDELADRCREPGCEHYGKSKSCPPNVAGPSWFKKLLKNYSRAVLFKIDVPSDILFSSERFDVFRLLHTTAAGIEQAAIEMGCSGAQAFAGGSCKELFCSDHRECQALSKKGTCRNPDQARPSMSGFGIDVASLFKAAGWNMDWVFDDNGRTKTKMANVSGLVLID